MTGRTSLILTRLISLMMIVGGVFGVAAVQGMVAASLPQLGPREIRGAALLGTFFGLFGFTAWTGWGLWKGQTWAHKWAKWLLIAQVPKIIVPGFLYHFYSTLVLFLFYSKQTDSKVGFDFELGSSVALWVSHQTEVVFGVNLVALVALILLIRAKPPNPSLATA